MEVVSETVEPEVHDVRERLLVRPGRHVGGALENHRAIAEEVRAIAQRPERREESQDEQRVLQRRRNPGASVGGYRERGRDERGREHDEGEARRVQIAEVMQAPPRPARERGHDVRAHEQRGDHRPAPHRLSAGG